MNAQRLDSATNPAPPDLDALLARMRAAHLAHAPGYAERIDDLERTRAAFKRRLPGLVAAVTADFGRRSRHETLVADGMTVLHDIDYALAKLRHWMKPQPARVGTTFWPARAEVRYQPLGVIGVISPWNYPINLGLMPVTAALAAGNHVLLKPSEHTPRTSAAIGAMYAELFPDTKVAVVEGDAEVARRFSELPFDHLFFTGSTAVGRLVMMAAAKNLVPVTLELGGKSPAILAPGFSVETFANRIATGKFFNAGQTCIAPDYVMLPHAQVEPFVDALRDAVVRAYREPGASDDYTAVVNDRQYQRLVAYLDDARARKAKVVELAPGDAARRALAPTAVLDAPDDAAVMREEIFGPILPIVSCESVDAAIDYVNARPRPLALYHFDHDKARTERVLERTIAGGVTVNDTMVHFAQAELPFGGVGPSGLGAYHGYEGFRTFSKAKPVFYQARFPGSDYIRPPYGKFADALVRLLTR